MSSGGPDATRSTSLEPLTPAYIDNEHKVYLEHLKSALTGKDSGQVHNIALTGGYGVGKSSVLQKLSNDPKFKEKTVSLSLATLGYDAPSGDEPADVASSVTNRIQKEIVKQLLYRERPGDVPGSRYHRRTGFNWRRGIATAALASATLIIVLYLTHAADRLADLMGHDLLARGSAYALLAALSVVVLTALQRALHDQVRITQLGAGPANVSLGEASETYFDEWLDEIVYFFEATKVNIVIFEDIDRFDDPHIFETLRALNTILNSSKQLDERNIRFIYAIKDSIFDQLGRSNADQAKPLDAAAAEVARANRTKFFDLVIPIVPFITHSNARDLMSRMLEQSQLTVSPALVDLAARHVADMRLITNIRNEFVVFRQKILGEGGIPGLTEDHLFAMILYKNVHLSDFELIRTGQSLLDSLYRAGRQLVNDAVPRLDQRRRALNRIVTDPDPLTARSEDLGNRLEAYINRVTSHLGNEAPPRYLEMSGRHIPLPQLRDVEFWREFLQSARLTANYNRNPYGLPLLAFTVDSIGEGLGIDLSLDLWKEHDSEAARENLERAERDRLLLLRADMATLFQREDFMLKKEGREQSFADITRATLNSSLARELIASGYIDRNFTLYVSQYHGVRVKGEAMNFILHNVQPNDMDLYFPFESAQNIEAVLRESGPTMLHERCSYNIAIIDYLIENDTARSMTIVQRLSSWGEDEQAFVRAYVTDGKNPAFLIRQLSGIWPQMLPIVVTDLEANEALRAELVNAALLGAAPQATSTASEQVRDYIERNYQFLPAFTADSEASSAEDLVALLDEYKVKLSSLKPLSTAVREHVIDRWMYTLTRENLALAAGLDPNDLALDRLREFSPLTYRYVLVKLRSYTEIAKEAPKLSSISEPANFQRILEEVAAQDLSLIPAIIDLSTADCRIEDLTEVTSVTWQALAGRQRFPLTFANVKAYTDEFGINEVLAVSLLADQQITDWDKVPESDRAALAVQILNANLSINDPAVRVKLAKSLGLEDPLGVDRITWEDGELAGLLVAAGLIADNGSVYDAVAGNSSQTKEFLISKSANFRQYVTPAQLPAKDLRWMLTSPIVTDTTKRAMLARLPEFATMSEHAVLEAAAESALKCRAPLTPETLMLLADGEVKTGTVMRLLVPALADCPLEMLIHTLTAMGDPYARLAAPGARPARLPNDPAHLALVERLKQDGDVNSWSVEHGNTRIKVNMKRR